MNQHTPDGTTEMPLPASETVHQAWIRLLRWVDLARNYPMAYWLTSFGGAGVRNPVLEALLPSVLYVQVTSLLDDALDRLIVKREIPWPPKVKHDLYNRIELTGDLLRDRESCHAVRRKRKDLAHEPDASTTWAELDAALETVQGELEHLGLAGPRPRYEAFAEKSEARASRHSQGAFGFDCAVGLKENGRIVAQYTWSTEVLKGDVE